MSGSPLQFVYAVAEEARPDSPSGRLLRVAVEGAELVNAVV